jgi:hypothetical protein
LSMVSTQERTAFTDGQLRGWSALVTIPPRGKGTLAESKTITRAGDRDEHAANLTGRIRPRRGFTPDRKLIPDGGGPACPLGRNPVTSEFLPWLVCRVTGLRLPFRSASRSDKPSSLRMVRGVPVVEVPQLTPLSVLRLAYALSHRPFMRSALS